MKLGLDFTVKINDAAIVNDLNTFYNAFATTATIQASKKIEKFAQKEMSGYYSEYDPEYYDRTGQMRNHSFKRFAVKAGNVREGGILVNPGFTNHEPKGITESEIYENVWDLGLHGRRVNHLRHYGEYLSPVASDPVYIQGEPNRFGKIEEMIASGDFQNEMFQLGLNAAMKQKYSVLRFS